MLCDPKDRYQFQPWYIKLWRRRHTIPVPYYALRSWWRHLDKHDPTPFRFAWDIEMGWAHIKMGWWITSEEMDYEERTTRKNI
jgi:hypothetical protein